MGRRFSLSESMSRTNTSPAPIRDSPGTLHKFLAVVFLPETGSHTGRKG